MAARYWSLYLDVGDDGWIEVRASVDGVPLKPSLGSAASDEVLAYAEAALVDFRRGDAIAAILTTNGARTSSCIAPNKHIVMSWLALSLIDQRVARLEKSLCRYVSVPTCGDRNTVPQVVE